jgi:hypothetical protein
MRRENVVELFDAEAEAVHPHMRREKLDFIGKT